MNGSVIPRTCFKSRAAACAIWLMIFCAVSFAQTGTSSVRGTVFDPQGHAVVGATLTLLNKEKNFSRTVNTSGEGSYIFTAVPPGLYSLEAEASGFRKSVQNDVNAQVDTPREINFSLEIGNVGETVTVTTNTEAQLNTSDATIGNTFESKRIENLPLNARNVVGLLSLQPGVTRGGYVNGGRADQSNITLDGVDVNEQQNGLDVVTGEAFASVLRVTPDSVQEFRVVTTNPNVDSGRSSGAQVSLITKSGTNSLHGSLYEFHRNTIFSANDFFNNAAGRYIATDPQVVSGQARAGEQKVPRPKLLRNIFGGSLGGPIIKDRAFFFFNYEGFREATGTSVVERVPLASLGQGIIRYNSATGVSDPSCPTGTPAGIRCLTTAQINAAYLAANGVSPGINADAVAYLADKAKRYPANDTTVGDGLNTGGFRFNANTPTNYDTYTAKFDFNLTSRQTMYVRGNYQKDVIVQPGLFPDVASPSVWNHPKGLAIGHFWTISNALINRLTYGFTRAAFSQQGDVDQNQIAFRFIFDPTPLQTATLARITPLHNFVDDLTWTKGNHTIQLGGNVRLINNRRTSFAGSFDFLSTNPSGYAASGSVLTSAGAEGDGDPIFPDVASNSLVPLGNALAAFIGRFSQYNANFNYDQSGKLLPAGTPTTRNFATQEYETYWQDSWRLRPNFTLTYGLRWSTATPVYEVNGFQVQPVQSLGQFFERRKESADKGVPFNDLITLDRSGKANGKSGYYHQDWNNFAPSIAFAWSPNLGENLLSRLIGRQGKSVIRGGFRMTYDRIGSQLAVNFDLNNQLGFASALTSPVSAFNLTDNLGPKFTNGQIDVRGLPLIAGNFNSSLTFPLTQPADQAPRVETSLDDTIRTPYNYNVNFSYGRELWKGLSFETSYVGRFARKLLAQRDIMQFNNIRDSKSGVTWYQAVRQLVDLRYQGVPITAVQPIPFFENVLPGIAGTFNVLGKPTALTSTQRFYRQIALPSVGGRNTLDYTFLQSNDVWNNTPAAFTDNLFVHPQYAALNTWSTVGFSNYNSAQLSIRQRFKKDVTFDFNYTLSHSLDNASGLQNALNFSSQSLIFNALDPASQYANSDFDVRHVINANWLVGLPVGRGKKIFHDLPKVADAILGGWQLTGIYRWNSGFPLGGIRPFTFRRWGTNWQISSALATVKPLQSSPSKNVNGTPNLFSNPQAAFESFRDPYPGEGGDRNTIRLPGYVSLDAGLHKTFNMPWEGHQLTFRWEVFNVTNTQRFNAPSGGGFGLSADPFLLGGTPPADFGKFTGTQTPLNETKAGRVMQFALRYVF